jgi:hypothetical protein
MRFVPLLALLACTGPPDAAARAYADAMRPLFSRNDELGQQFLSVASRLKKGESDGRSVGEEFERTALPLAKDLAERVAAVAPTDEALVGPHARLVAAWTDRAAAYQACSQAFGAGDTEAFESASRRAMAVRDAELDYVDAVNAATLPVGVRIDLYPMAGASP